MKKLKRLLALSVWLAGGSASAVPSAEGLYATLQTTMGDICLELFYRYTPCTAANFVSLAEGSRSWIDPRNHFISDEPYYNGIVFHRVISNFVIQAGSPKGDGTDGPGYTFKDEFYPEFRHDRPGTLSMANSGFDSNGGQFFIAVKPEPGLDGIHSVFGFVTEGMAVVSNIAAVATGPDNRPLANVTITNVFITRNGTEAQNFDVTGHSLPDVLPLPISVSSDGGLHLSATTDASSYQYVYRSTNLTDWTQAASGYWPDTSDDWVLPIQSESREFFRAARVLYTPDTNITMDVANHHLVVTVPSQGVILQAWPEADSKGVFNYQNFPDDGIVSWTWSREPQRGVFFVETDYPEYYTFLLHYDTPTQGRCAVYYYSGGWMDWGKGTFTDETLNP